MLFYLYKSIAGSIGTAFLENGDLGDSLLLEMSSENPFILDLSGSQESRASIDFQARSCKRAILVNKEKRIISVDDFGDGIHN